MLMHLSFDKLLRQKKKKLVLERVLIGKKQIKSAHQIKIIISLFIILKYEIHFSPLTLFTLQSILKGQQLEQIQIH